MTECFYNDLSPYYKLVYLDWESSIQRQAGALNGVIREFFGQESLSIWDVACGIGTQSIGLAALGYQMTASDISSSEIEVAKQEATNRGLQIDFFVTDMRSLDYSREPVDIIIACDNAIPHLLTNPEILETFKGFYNVIKKGGGCIISVRDYAAMDRTEKQKMIPRTLHKTDTGQTVMIDVWNFDGDIYEITTYVIEDTGKSQAITQVVRGGKYYCVELPTLVQLFQDAGFSTVLTVRDRFFQPLILAIRN
jgi:ubiquinone/menaquinone biosynthesis C-methylase UbiE